jgi:hypothetical protein
MPDIDMVFGVVSCVFEDRIGVDTTWCRKGGRKGKMLRLPVSGSVGALKRRDPGEGRNMLLYPDLFVALRGPRMMRASRGGMLHMVRVVMMDTGSAEVGSC